MNENEKMALSIFAMAGGSLSSGFSDTRAAGFSSTSNATISLEHLQAVRVEWLDCANTNLCEGGHWTT